MQQVYEFSSSNAFFFLFTIFIYFSNSFLFLLHILYVFVSLVIGCQRLNHTLTKDKLQAQLDPQMGSDFVPFQGIHPLKNTNFHSIFNLKKLEILELFELMEQAKWTCQSGSSWIPGPLELNALGYRHRRGLY